MYDAKCKSDIDVFNKSLQTFNINYFRYVQKTNGYVTYNNRNLPNINNCYKKLHRGSDYHTNKLLIYSKI